jgi:RecA/RadA recombinase
MNTDKKDEYELDDVEKKLQKEMDEQEGPADVTAEDLNDTMKSIKVETDSDEVEPLKPEAVIDDLYSEFGKFLKVKAKLLPDSGTKIVVPTPIKILNAYIGGGFPVGAMSQIVGTPGSGKSMLAIQTIGSGQLKFKNFLASYLDSEEATTSVRLSNLGVRYPKIKPYSDCTIEKIFKHLETTCIFKELKEMQKVPSIMVWDSIANTLSEKEREAEDVNKVIGFKARLLSMLVPKYLAKCAQYSIAWVAINQLRDELKLTTYTPPKDLKFLTAGKTVPGGQSLKYNAFTMLEMRPGGNMDPELYGFEGVIIKCKTIKCKLFPPNQEINLVGSFVTGFSDFWTSFLFLREQKRIKAPGGWLHIVNDPEQRKFRAKEAENLYKSDPKFKKTFDDAVDEVIKNEIVDRLNPIIE